MKNENVKPAPRKLHKPAPQHEEMKREELVTYADEAGGGGMTTLPFINPTTVGIDPYGF